MNDAYVFTGIRGDKEITGVFFKNGPFDYKMLKAINVQNAQVERVQPVTTKPNQPTAYVIDGNAVEVFSFDWKNEPINRIPVNGDPHILVPEISGAAAESTLYKPICYIIKGSYDRGKTPGLGVLLLKPRAGEELPKIDPKFLANLGFSHVRTVESVRCDENVKGNLFFMVERSPSASEVTVSTLCNRGEITSRQTVSGDPSQILPRVDTQFSFAPTVPPSKRSIAPLVKGNGKRQRAINE